jgi:hypothetical protein
MYKVSGSRLSKLAESRSKALEAGLGIRFVWEQIRIPYKRFYDLKMENSLSVRTILSTGSSLYDFLQ